MQIAQVMAGFTLGGADLLRRAMGKKKPEEMAKQKAIFIDGCKNNGIDSRLAENIFDLVEKFAGYGFNKSHSAAYALVSYQTLWLKAHYTAEFMAAVLTADMQNTDKVVTLVEECRSLGLELVLPNVNSSEYTFTVNDRGQIVYGLGAIKGLGEGPIQSIVTARKEAGPFRDLFDFCSRVDMRKLNKRALEALIRAGAMDEIGSARAHLMASIEKAVQQADQQARNADAGIVDMFGDSLEAGEGEDPYAEVAHLREWSEKQRLQGEKETLGLYLTGHPFDEYESEVRRFAPCAVADLKPAKKAQRVAGLVVAVRLMKNKRGQTMAFATLDDRSGRIEVTLFSEAWNSCKEILRKDAVVVVEGEVGHDDYSGSLKVRGFEVYDVVDARRRFGREVRVSLDSERLGNGLLKDLAAVLKPHRGEGCPLSFAYAGDRARTLIRTGSEWSVDPTDELLMGLRHLVGDNGVELVYD